MNEQIMLVDRASYPLESELEDEGAALTQVERLVVLGQSTSKGFDPDGLMVALRIMERAYKVAAIDMGARLIADMIIGQESEQQLHKRWADWFGAGDREGCALLCRLYPLSEFGKPGGVA